MSPVVHKGKSTHAARPEDPTSQGDAFVSPSFAPAGAASFEVKFLLAAAKAAAVEAWARGNLGLDSHGDPALAGGYEVSTLYLDTPRFDVFHRAKELEGAKFRLRRYGSAGLVYLERKRRRGDRVQKRRSEVEEGDLKRLASARAGTAWPGDWFQDEIEARGFRPVCRLTYLRVAFFGASDHGHFRLTLDRAVRCGPADGWRVGRVEDAGARPVVGGLVVCELKFRDAMPQPFKVLVAGLGLASRSVSKYRRACLAAGLVDGRTARDA
ncbi:MAG: polyphosphate polymerase domain-containing protein [Planctomycetota bacterium]